MIVKEEAIKELREYFKLNMEGKAQTCVSIPHVAPSNLSRIIHFVGIMAQDGEIIKMDLDNAISQVCGYKLATNYYGLKVIGGGMNMIYAVLRKAYLAVYPEDVHGEYISKATQYFMF